MYVAVTNEQSPPSVLFLHGGNVAGWMWEGQVATLADHHCLVPDLPGFGASADQDWTSLADVADQLADLIGEHAHGGRAHVVGLSLGGILGSILTARHPERVRSTLVTGAALRGVHGPTRWFGLAQVRLWDKRWYWNAMARAFRLPGDAVPTFVSTGLGIRTENAVAMMTEVYDGVAPADLGGLQGSEVPLLALAGEREPRTVARSFAELTSRSGAVTTRRVPRMHHAWNAEDPALFNEVMRDWLTSGAVNQHLMPA
ncbi:alpha/beta fold hydrolase [Occultella aeris]|uniref:2-succinyl-6-hydroxy-2, 4-cyclohexadiene-1-carboxylate synthase n=1 Tax=Occultella aeris TaxID=2761496 RepID=A0A7M4DQ52_9MICO|nr:alpha/beta hydrolase [Occultella aeris]VZO39596.1 2-succinyl-6-hydroxy-2, 4-cyclohexadiene-1-carboxylate synthase [Occultella aeris]